MIAQKSLFRHIKNTFQDIKNTFKDIKMPQWQLYVIWNFLTDTPYDHVHNMHLTSVLINITISLLHFHNYFCMDLVHLGVNNEDDYHSWNTFIGCFVTTIGGFTWIIHFLLLPSAFIRSNSASPQPVFT